MFNNQQHGSSPTLQDARSCGVTGRQYFARHFDKCGKSEEEVAAEAGFSKPNVIRMFVRGQLKIPVTKMKLLADAVGADAKTLYVLTMLESGSQAFAALEDLTETKIRTDFEERIQQEAESRGFDTEEAQCTPECVALIQKIRDEVEQEYRPYAQPMPIASNRSAMQAS